MRDRDDVLGRGGVFINTLGLAGAAMFLAFAVLTATGPSNSLGVALQDAALFGVLAAFMVLIATTSVRVEGRCLTLVRLVSVTVIPFSSIKRVTGGNGLEIETLDGDDYTHIGYGSSLLGSLTGNRRSTRVADAANRAMAQQAAESPRRPVITATSRPRPGLCLVVVLPALFCLIAGVIHG